MRIEPVTAADAVSLLEIYGPYVKKTAVSFEYTVPTVEEFADRIAAISAKYPYIKAVEESGRILGYAYAGAFKGRAAYNWAVETTVYVRRENRRAGVGRMLYEELERRLRAMGILNMNACIAFPKEGRTDLHLTDDSVRFHRKMGFTEAAHFHDCGYKFDTWYDMVWMEKIIGEHTAGQAPVSFGVWNQDDMTDRKARGTGKKSGIKVPQSR